MRAHITYPQGRPWGLLDIDGLCTQQFQSAWPKMLAIQICTSAASEESEVSIPGIYALLLCLLYIAINNVIGGQGNK